MSPTKTPAPEKGKVPKVPETILKRQKASAEARAKNARREGAKFQANRKLRKEIMQRTAKYEKDYAVAEKGLVNCLRLAKKEGNFYVPPQPKLGFVIRVRGLSGVPPKPRKILQLFRLRQMNNGTFVKLNKATLNMLRMAEPYIAWGYPNLKSVRDLIYKRGYVRLQQRRIPITDNEVIQQHRTLDRAKIQSVEDMVHEIYTVGPHFKQVNKYLWSFKLNNPRGGWRKKTNHFVDGGDVGNRETHINRLLRKMI